MSTVTTPILLDETGQAILTQLRRINSVEGKIADTTMMCIEYKGVSTHASLPELGKNCLYRLLFLQPNYSDGFLFIAPAF